MSDTVQIITLGCPKNEVDSEIIGNIISKSGNKVQENEEGATAILINTCGFIEDAKKETLDQIKEAIKLKKNNKIKKVYIAGCMVKRYKKELASQFKEVDEFFSVTDFENISKTFDAPYWKPDNFDRFKLSHSHYAYLKISEGCNLKCSFCAIPAIRGEMRSRPLESLLIEAKMLVQRGVREISVISEDTTKYGKDLKAGYDLCTLLVELNKIPELRWIRLLYSYPGSVTDELIDVIGNSEKICNYIDMPIQHISDPVLSRMNRTYKRNHVETVIKKLRSEIPGIAIRTTVIVGFPGETKQNFIELSDFLTDMEFERLGVFEYSDEEGTEAYNFDGKIDSEEISERFEELKLNQDNILEQTNSGLIGKTFEVIVDGKDETSGDFIGRTYMDAPEIDLSVRILREVNTGEFTTVKIENASTFEIIGK